ncbi:hypothetical protein L227DRAFT_47674 [Lentinus tigrinus ALCF2SS1-6]|uniref:Uncharacterized protein n=1 Tax=Lentinus tigrinus ALCF2SS1-6 TaxID=1328759 RepID=A0A5C2SKP5_9APHY|nr:hypothetical protein L227DRAFT_47674 [Lentinus tigrinus ALCF2SS1-6]
MAATSRSCAAAAPVNAAASEYHCGVHPSYPRPLRVPVANICDSESTDARRSTSRYVPMAPGEAQPCRLLNASVVRMTALRPASYLLFVERMLCQSSKRIPVCSKPLEPSAPTLWPREWASREPRSFQRSRPCPAASNSGVCSLMLPSSTSCTASMSRYST